jgi:hypothetical protein
MTISKQYRIPIMVGIAHFFVVGAIMCAVFLLRDHSEGADSPEWSDWNMFLFKWALVVSVVDFPVVVALDKLRLGLLTHASLVLVLGSLIWGGISYLILCVLRYFRRGKP